MSANDADIQCHEAAARSLDDIGMPEAMARELIEALAQPASLVLIAGSPGTGRTTTANALLAGVRHGSAMLAITDVRDRPSAADALDKALSGRCVLATIDSPDAVSAIRHMRELIADPFLLALTLRAVAAQRLVRRLCPACCTRSLAQGSEASLLGFDSPMTVHQPAGCTQCGGEGFQGLIGVFEAIRVDEAIRRLIATGDEPLIASHAFRNAPNMVAAVRALVLHGTTSPAEAIRLLRERPLPVSIAIDRPPAENANKRLAP